MFVSIEDVMASDYRNFQNIDVIVRFNLKTSAGILFEFSFVQFYLSLYLSHPEKGDGRFITQENISKRIFFTIRLPRISFG